MTRRYTYACTLSWGGDEPTAEVEVEVSYTVAWGTPETGNYGPPEDYDPGGPSVVEDVRLESVEGKPRPWGMYSGYIANEDDEFATVCVEKIEGCDRHLEAMLNEASEAEAAREDEGREWAAEENREVDRIFGAIDPDH